MEQHIFNSFAGLHGQLQDSIGGAVKYGDALDLTKITEVVLRAKLAALDAADGVYRAARDAQTSAQRELDRASAQAREIIPRVVAALSLTFGDTFNSSWQQIGLVDSLAVPATHAGRAMVLHKTALYLNTHPAAAIPLQGITEAAMAGLYDAYTDAQNNVLDCETETGEARVVFDTQMADGQHTLRGLVKELDLSLSPTDPRWKAFGLNVPGYPAVPDQVLDLIVTPQLARCLYLEWGAAPRAARYQVEMQLLAPDAEWTLMTTVAETNATLTELTPGANVLLRVTAVNDGGSGVPSEPVQAQVPVALAA